MPRDTGAKARSMNAEDYTFFWTPNLTNGWASQWYPSPFTVLVAIDGSEESLYFPTAEHWMMLQKALLFSDIEIARQIMTVTSVDKSAMTKVKALGRQVKNFNDKVWNKHREKIVLQGTLHKFRQNKELREKLLDTGDTQLVEASPRDRIWGIGFGEKSALERTNNWGLNLLGLALEEARRLLREEYTETKHV